MQTKTLEVKDVYFDAINENKSFRVTHVRLLNGISIKLESGKVTAIMGSNGSGKSTLVNLLIGNVLNDSKTSGSISFCGEERVNAIKWIETIAFADQKDVYIKSLFVEQYLEYEIRFYRKDLDSKEQDDLLFKIMTDAGIIHKRYEIIGDLSGGELKKVMIANVMLQKAEIIFMDEPTSWLDSWNANVFVRNMKKFAAENNIIVVIIINQPGQELFELFDDLVFIKPGGNLFYNGPISELDNFLKDNSLKKPENVSTATFLFSIESQQNLDSTIPVEGQTISNTLNSSVKTHGGLNETFTGKEFSFKDVVTLIRRRFSYGYIEGEFGLMFYVKLLLCLWFSYVFGNGSNNDKNDSKISSKVDNLVFITLQLYSFFNIFSKLLIPAFYGKHEILSYEIFSGKFSSLTLFVSSAIFDLGFKLISYSLVLSFTFFKHYKEIIKSVDILLLLITNMFFYTFLMIPVNAVYSRAKYLILLTAIFFLGVFNYFVIITIFNPAGGFIHKLIFRSLIFGNLITNPSFIFGLIHLNKISQIKGVKGKDLFETFFFVSLSNWVAYLIFAIISIIIFIMIYLRL